MSHVKGASILAAYLKMLPFIFIILPGMISRALYPGACTHMWADYCKHTPFSCKKVGHVHRKQVVACSHTTSIKHPFNGICISVCCVCVCLCVCVCVKEREKTAVPFLQISGKLVQSKFIYLE